MLLRVKFSKHYIRVMMVVSSLHFYQHTEYYTLEDKGRWVILCIHFTSMFSVLASSGIDYNIKVWSPSAEKDGYDEEKVAEVSLKTIVIVQ